MASPGASPTASPGESAAPVTIGFDLDMTLIDSRPGIHATWRRLSAETGVRIDADLAVSRLGPPLHHELSYWFAEQDIPEAAARYRSLYPHYAIEPTPALAGAREALDAVRAAGGRALVVTAKHQASAQLHLDHLGLEPYRLIGELWAEGKAEALLAHRAAAYVGDHVGDVRGARMAGVVSVAVATGPCSAAELTEAGADLVLPDLTAFPRWLREFTPA
ncbi:HAD family hydrolase [Streptomyces axinellae]|uniref:HAD family hydrolase n=2 Tax=Streptomyces axinellae TaxID=552788 RepID=A0ABN3QC19_9ACTN